MPSHVEREQESDRWRDRFQQADSLPVTASASEKRQRGRDFEQILTGMLAEADLEPHASFRPQGEEIDGSFLYRGRVMLLEAKWTQDPLPASSIYQFRGKVEGKLVGTIGVFVSMSGFSMDSVNALIAGKTINTILFDGDDIRAIAADRVDIVAALDRKLRAAAEGGAPFWVLHDPTTGQLVTPSTWEGQPANAKVVVVEGRLHALLVHALVDELGPSNYQLEVLPSGGPLSLPATANVVHAVAWNKRIVIIADGDGDPEAVERWIEDRLDYFDPDYRHSPTIVVFDQTFEETFGISGGFSAARRQGLELNLQSLKRYIRDADIPVLANKNPEVRRLLTELGLSDTRRSR